MDNNAIPGSNNNGAFRGRNPDAVEKHSVWLHAEKRGNLSPHRPNENVFIKTHLLLFFIFPRRAPWFPQLVLFFRFCRREPFTGLPGRIYGLFLENISGNLRPSFLLGAGFFPGLLRTGNSIARKGIFFIGGNFYLRCFSSGDDFYFVDNRLRVRNKYHTVLLEPGGVHYIVDLGKALKICMVGFGNGRECLAAFYTVINPARPGFPEGQARTGNDHERKQIKGDGSPSSRMENRVITIFYQFFHPCSPIRSTKRHPQSSSCLRSSGSSDSLVNLSRICELWVPTGITRRPPMASCSIKSLGTFGAPAIAMIAAKGDSSRHPKVPSPTRMATL